MQKKIQAQVQKPFRKTLPNPHASNLIPRGQQAIQPQLAGQEVDIAAPAGIGAARFPSEAGMPQSAPGQRKQAFAGRKPVDPNAPVKPFQRRGANPFR
jgi:hypothetical protein